VIPIKILYGVGNTAFYLLHTFQRIWYIFYNGYKNSKLTPPIKPFKHKRQQQRQAVFRQKFLSLKEHLTNYRFIYMDGSKSAQGVSYSITTPLSALTAVTNTKNQSFYSFHKRDILKSRPQKYSW